MLCNIIRKRWGIECIHGLQSHNVLIIMKFFTKEWKKECHWMSRASVQLQNVTKNPDSFYSIYKLTLTSDLHILNVHAFNLWQHNDNNCSDLNYSSDTHTFKYKIPKKIPFPEDDTKTKQLNDGSFCRKKKKKKWKCTKYSKFKYRWWMWM